MVHVWGIRSNYLQVHYIMGYYFLVSLIIAIVQFGVLGLWLLALPSLLEPGVIRSFFLLIPFSLPVLSILGIIFSVISRVKRERGFPIIAGLLNFSILAMLGYAFLVAIYSGI